MVCSGRGHAAGLRSAAHRGHQPAAAADRLINSVVAVDRGMHPAPARCRLQPLVAVDQLGAGGGHRGAALSAHLPGQGRGSGRSDRGMSASRPYGPRERGRRAGDRYLGEALVRIASMDGSLVHPHASGRRPLSRRPAHPHNS